MSADTFAAIDLDNCISDDGWRKSFIDMGKESPVERFARYHASCRFDLPGVDNYHLIKQIAKYHQLLIFTARPVIQRQSTIKWLKQWKVPFRSLYMRQDNDTRSSVEVKREQLHIFRRCYAKDVAIAIDDREDICEMYRSEGVMRVFQLAIHEPANKEQP